MSKACQQSVQRTGGILRLRQAVSTPEHFSALGVFSRPAPPPLTQTVRRQYKHLKEVSNE